jgi:two-component system, NarL family, nitrate/nitrite response regulator NarL
MSDQIEIIIADDHTLFIDGLIGLLKDEPGLTVVDIANDGKELLELLGKRQADVILLDINMPNMNGIDAARFIKQTYPPIKMIMLSTYNDDHLVEKAKKLGTNGYLLKTVNKEELIQTIKLVHTGQSCFPYRSPRVINEFDKNDELKRSLNLTKREIEIINLIKKEYTNQQIADKLFLSIYTVETHRKNIMQKLGLNNPTSLMKFIINNNI